MRFDEWSSYEETLTTTGGNGSSPPSTGLQTLPRPVAAVVGGGGVFGAAQVGVGYALERHGFVPDLIVGTSVGALHGAIV